MALDSNGTPIPCVDYVQTHRDNAGNLIAYVLFTQDPRLSFG